MIQARLKPHFRLVRFQAANTTLLCDMGTLFMDNSLGMMRFSITTADLLISSNMTIIMTMVDILG